jgi:hypothetical protein
MKSQTHTYGFLGVVAGLAVAFFSYIVANSTSSHPLGPRRLIQCQARLRFLGQSMLLYAQDHSGRYPDSWATLMNSRGIEPEAFFCPAMHGTPSTAAAAPRLLAASDYLYLGDGVDDTAGSDVILAIDHPGDHEHGTVPILFGDGSVVGVRLQNSESLPTDVWDAIDVQILNGTRPVRWPASIMPRP